MPSVKTYNFNGLGESRMHEGVVGIVKSLFNDYLKYQSWASVIWPGSGHRAGSREHASGRAVDIIISPKVGQRPTEEQKKAGERLVELLIRHGRVLGLQWVLWSRDGKVTWSYNMDRGSWIKLTGKGSISANHVDHIHAYFKTSAKLPSKFQWSDDSPTATVPESKPVAPSWDGKSFPGEGAFMVGQKHDAVKVVQERLKVHGYDPGKVDSYWGRVTSVATRKFQLAQGWTGSDADGVPGPTTWERLLADPRPSGPSAANPHRYRVTTRSARLNGRAGPGTQYRVTMTAVKGYVLSIVEIRNGWARSTGGHWYSMQYLTKV